MSFQKGHQISNELAEVIVTSDLVDTTSLGTGVYPFSPAVAVAGINYRVLEVGYTVIVAGTNTADAAFVKFGIDGTSDSFVRDCGLPANPAAKLTVSTSENALAECKFQPASTGSIDADGVPQLESGERILVTGGGNVTDGPKVIFFARLAPNVQYKG